MGIDQMPPRRRSFCARMWVAWPVVLACALVAHAPSARGEWWNPFAKQAPAGTAEWWKKHKTAAVFEPGKGYMVPGVEGYFDGDGRPIQSPVAVERVVEAGEVEDEVGLIPGLDPRAQYDKMKSAVGLGPNEQYARQAYGEGDRLFGEKKYSAAAEQFQQAVARGPHSPIEQDAMFMEAESYFFGDRYIKARDAYDALVKKHPNTRYMDTVIDREWKIARYWEEYEQRRPDWLGTPNMYDKTRPWFDTLGHAIKTYDNIRLNDPTGPRADDAIMATANIYFERGRYEDADYHYGLLRREYPRSELQYEAHLLGLQSKLRKYQGEDYDGTPLEEAKALVKQLRMQFADRLPAEEKTRLQTTEGQLNLEIATRDYRMAEYFDGTKHYGAARYYYAQVVKKYPETELGAKARERMGQIANEPENPPKRLAWFVDLFPENSERSRVARIPELQNGGGRRPEGGRLAEAPQGPAPDSTPPVTTTR
jgi:outer membrane protein assembly factor BamD (BamD/ComL family)